MKREFLIGEVAKSFGISRPALIYYDRIGLLTPSYTGPNGYRYYKYEDIDKLELILSLKECGLSLDEIKNFLSSPSHPEAVELLKNQKK